MKHVDLYDTTLRDGAQSEGVSYTLADKLNIAAKLDDFGIPYIEAGYPVSNQKDLALFRELAENPLKQAQIVAFGSTRKGGNKVENDPFIAGVLAVNAPVVAVVAKSWDMHVRDVLRVPLDENLAMIEDTVRYLLAKGRRVFFDAEHFFDGFVENPDYAMKTLQAAAEAGAELLVLCDTNGGMQPEQVGDVVAKVRAGFDVPLGIHAHNDSGLAVANTLAAVQAGCTQVQGTINGLGERCGNADLCAAAANLQLKRGCGVVPGGDLSKLTELSRYVAEVANVFPQHNQPFVGVSAFAHKGGLHVHAVARNTRTYEHIDPAAVGNERRILVSELSGAATVEGKTRHLPVEIDKNVRRKVLLRVQELENEGYQFEAAEASFDLLVRRLTGRCRSFFHLEGYRVIVERNEDGFPVTEATVKLKARGKRTLTASEGDGPVNALDSALRAALEPTYPNLADMHLADYKVRVINPRAGTAAKVRVIIESRDKTDVWGTVGVSENLIEASWQALADSVVYKLLKDEDAAAVGDIVDGNAGGDKS